MQSQVDEVFPGPLILKLKVGTLRAPEFLNKIYILDFLKENLPDFKRNRRFGCQITWNELQSWNDPRLNRYNKDYIPPRLNWDTFCVSVCFHTAHSLNKTTNEVNQVL